MIEMKSELRKLGNEMSLMWEARSDLISPWTFPRPAFFPSPVVQSSPCAPDLPVGLLLVTDDEVARINRLKSEDSLISTLILERTKEGAASSAPDQSHHHYKSEASNAKSLTALNALGKFVPPPTSRRDLVESMRAASELIPWWSLDDLVPCEKSRVHVRSSLAHGLYLDTSSLLPCAV